jgi:glycerol-3-phosphate acyltransferase PlsY
MNFDFNYLLILLLFSFLGYLIGSIPFGLILTKMSGLGDIRDIGSGNIGATNVLRTGNKKIAFLTLVLDGSKGALALFLLKSILTNTSIFNI